MGSGGQARAIPAARNVRRLAHRAFVAPFTYRRSVAIDVKPAIFRILLDPSNVAVEQTAGSRSLARGSSPRR